MATRLAQLDDQARALDASIAAAETQTAAAQDHLDAVTTELAIARERLTQVLAELEAARVRFREDAVEAYMRGGNELEVAVIVLEHADLGQSQLARSYAGAVLVDHQAAVDHLRLLEEDANLAERHLTESEAAAARARDDLAAIEARLEADRAALTLVRDETAAQVAAQRDLVSQAQAQRAAVQQHLAELEAESARIEAELKRRAAEEAASRGRPPPGSGQLGWPVDPPVRITSGFGYRTHPIFGDRRLHAGIDIDKDSGDAVYASAAGRVVRAEWCSGYGNCVVIDHGNGLATLYAHLSRIQTSIGASVARGARIGEVGSTGQSTGPHLHFEVRVNGAPVDPMPYLP